MRRMKFTVLFFLLLLIITAIPFTVSGINHQHDYKKSTVKPTCTKVGYTYYVCECGDSYRSDEVPASGHSYSKEYSVEKAPNCINKGIKSRYCLRCSERGYRTEIPVTDHIIKTVIYEASFNKDGEIREECTACNTVFSSEKISGISSVKLSQTSYNYDGKRKTPGITLTDSQGNILCENEDFSVEYPKGRKKTGRYKITVRLKGYYEGEKELYFNVRPNKVKNISFKSSTRSVYLSWSAVKGATGYRIYYYNKNKKKYEFLTDTKNLSYTVRKAYGKELEYGTDYKLAVKAYKATENGNILSKKMKAVSVSTKPDKACIKKVNISEDCLYISWKKQACDGYEVVYASNKSFSSAKVICLNKASENCIKIKNNTDTGIYFVKVRAYKITDGVKKYGFYSDVKTASD